MSINTRKLLQDIPSFLSAEGALSPKTANVHQLHNALSDSVMANILPDWQKSREAHLETKRACYFSAEFLVGRAIYNNLMCLGLTEKADEFLKNYGTSLSKLETVEDAALGNGGLGRLAACFLDSAATLGLPVDGYGIRYRYGLFKQSIEDGFQKEDVDDWTHYGDPWSLRRDDESVIVKFRDEEVRAVPYDMPIIGYKTNHISTLRLWQAEPTVPFDFNLFNDQDYMKAMKEKNLAENLSRVLYPNDTALDGKKLRLKQQYFFCSASLQDIIRKYRSVHGNDFSQFAEYHAIQLNDTHPVISIPELIRLLMIEGLDFDSAFFIAQQTFAYTNHTIMAEALEKWDQKLIQAVIPEIMAIIRKIDSRQAVELRRKKIDAETSASMRIIQNKTVHMAYLAVYASKYVNGVAEIHTEILKKDVLKDWYALYPERFQNKTNGITQRRWLKLCNPELSALITRLLGNERWIKNLPALRQLKPYAEDKQILKEFRAIKYQKKQQLADYLAEHENIIISPDTIFDVQIKRLHEYKRQFLNILSVLELYYEIKEGAINNFTPTTFIFAAKAAPGYYRAKAVIKLIHEVANLIDSDPEVSKYLKVVFIPNYNVSLAEKLVAAADVSEQISTAGTEASGTGNMKLMLNGAVTLGTLDGANIEIVKEAGEENNYIFGATVEEIESIKDSYDPMKIYTENPRVRRVLDALTDGTLDDGGTGMFKELKSAILEGASWHKPDHYYLLLDFERYNETRLRMSEDYKSSSEFAKKCWLNMCSAGKFSSDRTMKQYAKEIWKIEPVKIK